MIGGGVAIVVGSDTKLVVGISLSAVLVGGAGVESGSAEEPDREVVWVRTGRDPSEVVVIPDTVNELMETSVIDRDVISVPASRGVSEVVVAPDSIVELVGLFVLGTDNSVGVLVLMSEL